MDYHARNEEAQQTEAQGKVWSSAAVRDIHGVGGGQ
jgi:hypothetical protein